MNDTITAVEQHIGGAHANTPIISIKTDYHEGIDQVVVSFITYDHMAVFSVQLNPAAALELADQLADAYREWTTPVEHEARWEHLDGEPCTNGPDLVDDALCAEHGRLFRVRVIEAERVPA